MQPAMVVGRHLIKGIIMRYSMPVQVRYSELGPDGRVNLHKILEYFQDSSIFHSESLGYKVKDELERNRGWFLLAWNVEISRYPGLGERLEVITEPYKMRGFYGYRRFTMSDESGAVLAKADSLWLLMDLKKMLPQRVPKDMTQAYISDVSDDRIGVKRKLEEGGSWVFKEKITVQHYYLDSNAHVNNTFYVRWGEECLPVDYTLRKVMVDYRQSAFEHDTIFIDMIEEEDRIRCRFRNQEDTLLALIDFFNHI